MSHLDGQIQFLTYIWTRHLNMHHFSNFNWFAPFLIRWNSQTNQIENYGFRWLVYTKTFYVQFFASLFSRLFKWATFGEPIVTIFMWSMKFHHAWLHIFNKNISITTDVLAHTNSTSPETSSSKQFADGSRKCRAVSAKQSKRWVRELFLTLMAQSSIVGPNFNSKQLKNLGFADTS